MILDALDLAIHGLIGSHARKMIDRFPRGDVLISIDDDRSNHGARPPFPSAAVNGDDVIVGIVKKVVHVFNHVQNHVKRRHAMIGKAESSHTLIEHFVIIPPLLAQIVNLISA